MSNTFSIRLCDMTIDLAKLYFRDFCYDPAVFTDEQTFSAFVYNENWVEGYVLKQRQLQRIHLAIMQGQRPVGEIILKNIHNPKGSCTLSIHLQNDYVKNRGIGTQAETLALQYAFEELHLETIYANALHGNTRSQHVLEKVGFQKISEDHSYVYFRCNREGK